MELKRISPSSVPRALELCQHYRLLNEPDQAASISRDVLEVDPNNQDAIRYLLLSLTDQFGTRRGDLLREAEEVASRLQDPYESAYFRGIVYERWGRSKLHEGVPARAAGEWLQKAMELYEEAEGRRPSGDDSALLRWNTCARLLNREPAMTHENVLAEMHFGD